MNIPLKALLTIGLLASANYSAIADEAASAVPALQSIVERMKEMTPRQLAEEQKTLYETMQKMTPEERESTRNVMLDEWGKMTSEERNSLHDKGRSDEEKLLDREHLEHQNEPKESAINRTSKQQAAHNKELHEQQKALLLKKHQQSKRDKHNHTSKIKPPTPPLTESMPAKK